MNRAAPTRKHCARLLRVLALSLLVVPMVANAGLFFSEYVEGSGNNKALEIFNGTGNAVDLAGEGYSVQMFFNGSTAALTTIFLTGTVASGDVYVLAHPSADAAILAQADLASGTGWFNGDDAVVLRKGATFLDVIGQIGVDPGASWSGGGVSTQNQTLRRKSSVLTGDSDESNPFDPSIEWEGFAQDTFDGLGTHSVAAIPEPSTFAFLGVGLVFLAFLGRRKLTE